MSEAEYVPAAAHFNPAHPSYAGWAAGAKAPQPVAQPPASEEAPVPDPGPEPDEKPQPTRKRYS